MFRHSVGLGPQRAEFKSHRPLSQIRWLAFGNFMYKTVQNAKHVNKFKSKLGKRPSKASLKLTTGKGRILSTENTSSTHS